MIDAIKLLVGTIVALMEALPQNTSAGRIPDSEYTAIISGAVVGVAAGAGFQVAGWSDAQIRGAAAALVAVVDAWKAAVRT